MKFEEDAALHGKLALVLGLDTSPADLKMLMDELLPRYKLIYGTLVTNTCKLSWLSTKRQLSEYKEHLLFEKKLRIGQMKTAMVVPLEQIASKTDNMLELMSDKTCNAIVIRFQLRFLNDIKVAELLTAISADLMDKGRGVVLI